ncbi:MAG: hypothetical protein ACOYMA_21535, partial [Bacteroidia bacterium]
MKRTILMLLFFASFIPIKAQRQTGVLAHIFISDVYVGANVGPNAFLADGFSEYGFKDCYGISESLFIGYNLTKDLGVRMVASFSNLNWPGIKSRKIPAKNFHTKAMNVETIYNLSTTFDDFNLNRPLDFSMIAGVGFISREKTTNNNEYLSFFIKGGFQLDYRLNYKWDLSVQTNFNMLDERFNVEKFGRPFDLIPELKVGLT